MRKDLALGADDGLELVVQRACRDVLQQPCMDGGAAAVQLLQRGLLFALGLRLLPGLFLGLGLAGGCFGLGLLLLQFKLGLVAQGVLDGARRGLAAVVLLAQHSVCPALEALLVGAGECPGDFFCFACAQAPIGGQFVRIRITAPAQAGCQHGARQPGAAAMGMLVGVGGWHCACSLAAMVTQSAQRARISSSSGSSGSSSMTRAGSKCWPAWAWMWATASATGQAFL